MRRREVLTLGAAAAIAAPSLARGADRRVLKFVPQADLTILDPVWTTATVTRNYAFVVYDTLFGVDANYAATPQMAQGSTTENDGKLWTITLRPGLKFHDGEPVLAKDCVASIARWAKRDAFGQALMAVTDEMSAQDDKTIRFRLKKPFPLLAAALGKNTAFVPVIMPERLAQTDAFKQVTEVVGSGPYRFVPGERMVGARTVFERFADYKPREDGKVSWNAGPKITHFDRLEWTVMPDGATAAAALKQGEIDWWEYPTADLQPLLARDKNVSVVRLDPTGNIAILRMNHLLPPFDNPAIRRAILGAVNQSDYMSAVAGTDQSNWKAGIGVFAPGTPMASEAGMEVLTGPRDYEKVKRDLKAAGYKGEPVTVMGASDLSVIKAESEVGQDMFTRAGMNVDFQMLDWGTLVGRRSKKEPAAQGGWNVFFTGWSGTDQLNPIGHLSLRGNGDGAWFGWPTAPKIEELRQAWIDAPDLATQKTIAAEIQRQVFIDVPYIPLGQYFQPVAVRKDITDLVEGFPIFWGVKRD